ncbi:MAG: GAF domain-containing protein [Chloroflexi bacterium]|nr:GAF domain-containing protein [Chloroflexota bacterium]
MPVPLSILVLEDLPADAELIIHELRRSGFEVTWKRVETEGEFEAALNKEIDLILADYSLPQYNALQALHHLQESGLNIPFIVNTGTNSEEVAVECMKQGAADYLIKDRLARLGPAVRNALHENQLARTKHEAEERLTLLSTALEAAANTVVITDQAGTIVWVNAAFTHMTGYTFQQAVGHQSHLANPRAHDSSSYAAMWETIRSGSVWHGEIMNRHRDGSTYMAEMTITPVRNGNGEITNYIDIEQDITERKEHQRELEGIVMVANALRTAQTRSEMLPVILDQVVGLVKAQGASICLYDPAKDEMVVTLARGPFINTSGKRVPAEEGFVGRIVSSRQMVMEHASPGDDLSCLGPLDQPYMLAGIPLLAQGHVIGILLAGREMEFNSIEVRLLTAISEIAASAIHRSSLHEETELRLQHLSALREIDKAITSSLDIHLTLRVLVDQVVTQLSVHAADVLLFNSESQSLEHVASHGFRYNLPPASRSFTAGYAHRSVIERRVISISDIHQEKEAPDIHLRVHGEDFAAYFAVPLVAKGQVKGVLELFHRTPFYPNPEWLNFLETLAGQAAIAIDNAELFDNLQRSNINLALAYDGTIEGWSRALDLRDSGTEGHTQRVTEITLTLARAAGIRESDLIHIRRGALLHDIGKMAIPDSILHKPGPLNDEEWTIIRKHPVYAYDLLSPIEFLRPALDIPYCHHEWWDGNGYPRRLRGEEIPLSARLFSLADVYDGLISDRPYRLGWEREKTLKHIAELSGTQFDPDLTRLFLSMDW